MSIHIRTSGIHHVALRTSNLERAKQFYLDTLGFKLAIEFPGVFLFQAGNALVGVRAPDSQTPGDDRFNPFRVGLDHLALACADEAELERVAAALTAAGIENSGVAMDEALGKRYVSFSDPDQIAWEFYMV